MNHKLTGNFKEDIELVLNAEDRELLKQFLKRCWIGGEFGGPMITDEEESRLHNTFMGTYIEVKSEIIQKLRT